MHGWILSPLLGATVGYIHAWVAVKMIFWPKREYRLFGRRIPGTPGLFVARRRDFARQLAVAFTERFCAPADVAKALGQALESGLEGRVLTVLDRSISALNPIIRVQARNHMVARLSAVDVDDVEVIAREISDFVKQSRLIDHVMISNIDAMSVAEIEDMVRTVCSRELRAIVWSGAVLGLVIGLGQSVLWSLVTP